MVFGYRKTDGQNRNKVQACCRIVHKATGITARGTSSRNRSDNIDRAFRTLVSRLIAYLNAQSDDKPSIDNTVIRLYHEPRNQVKDLASGLVQSYKDVVRDADIGDMIEARKKSIESSGGI